MIERELEKIFGLYFNRSSSTDENPTPPTNPSTNPSTALKSFKPNFPTNAFVDFSSLAKPFEKTNNSLRFRQTVIKTDLYKPIPPNNIVKPKPLIESNNKNETKKVVSLTTGFSIRRNPDSSNSPYTLTILSRPLDNFNISNRRKIEFPHMNLKNDSDLFYDISVEDNKQGKPDKSKTEFYTRRKDSSYESEYNSDEEKSSLDFIQPKLNTTPKDESVMLVKKLPLPQSTTGSKYYLKVIKRPAPFSIDEDINQNSKENNIETDLIIDRALQNARTNELNNVSKQNIKQPIKQIENSWVEPAISPYTTLNNLRRNFEESYSTSTEIITSTPRNLTHHSSTNSNYKLIEVKEKEEETKIEPNIFSEKAKRILKVFFNNYDDNDKLKESSTSVTSVPITEKTVNIGFHKKYLKFDAPKIPLKNAKRVEIITEETPVKINLYPQENISLDRRTTNKPTTSTTKANTNKINDKKLSAEDQQDIENRTFDQTNDNNAFSHKFKTILLQNFTTEKSTDDYSRNIIVDNEPTRPTNTDYITPNISNFIDQNSDKEINNVIFTTKMTSVPLTSTKNYSPFPTRASRVNPAIKLAATNLGSGRRSYQSPSKCSSDDSLQANPKCNEIKYQRYNTPLHGQ